MERNRPHLLIWCNSLTVTLQNTVKHNEVGKRASAEAKIDIKRYVLLLK